MTFSVPINLSLEFFEPPRPYECVQTPCYSIHQA